MVGRVHVRAAVMLFVGSACSFESSSGSSPATLEDTDASTSGTPAGTGTTQAPLGTTAGTGGNDQGSTGAQVETSSEGVSTAVDPSQGNPPRADLVFVDPGPVEFGVHPLSGRTVLTLQLTNEGEAPATIVDGEALPSPLTWAGDAFPGTNGTCEGSIPEQGTCTVALLVGPGQPGLASGTVAVRFMDEVGAGTASVLVELTATGMGPNLIENADAESDPAGEIVTGWDTTDSTFYTTDQHNHGAGSLSFFGGGSGSPSLTQDLLLTPWSESIDELGLRFAFTGWTRSREDLIDDDPHAITLEFLDENELELDAVSRAGMTHDGWESTTFDVEIPAQTRRVRLGLRCNRNGNIPFNDNCSAWFDDFTGALVYAPK